MYGQSIPAVVMAGIVIFIGFYNLNVFFRQPQRREYLMFFLSCIAIGFFDVACCIIYNAPSPRTGAVGQRLQVVASSLLCGLLPWFLFEYFTGVLPASRAMRVCAVVSSACFCAAAAAMLLDPLGVFWPADTPMVKTIHFFPGATVVYNEVALSAFALSVNAFNLAIVVFIIAFLLRLSVRSRGKGILPVVSVLVLLLASAVGDAAVSVGLLSFPYTTEYSLMGFVLLITLSLSRRIVEAGKVQEALAASEARYRGTFKHSAVSLWVVDIAEARALLREPGSRGVTDLSGYLGDHPDFVRRVLRSIRVKDVNETTVRLFGAESKEEMLGPLDRTVDSSALPHVRDHLLAIAQGRSEYDIESTARTLDGRPLNVLVSTYIPRGTEDDDLMLVSLTDITARKEAEEALRQSVEQLRQAQKMEAVGTLAGGIAHDFNNLLTGILGSASLLVDQLPAGSALLDDAKTIESSAVRAAELVEQILTFSRQDLRVETRPMDLNAVVQEVVRLLERTVDKSIIIETALAGHPPRIMGNAGQIHQALLNLCLNACDAMPEGGRLSIATSADPPDAAPRKRIAISVTDTGIGMSEELQSRIFEPFYTTKELGRGLGLSMVYGIVHGHGGDISIMSEPGKGTTFRMILPATEVPAEYARSPSRSRRGGNETVLVIDDELSVRRVAGRMLREAGYAVLQAEDGAHGLALFSERRAEIDLVVLDLSMPGMSGAEVFEGLVALDPKVKVILSSGYSDDTRITAMLGQGGRSFLRKPYSMEKALQTVRETLDGRHA